ncbi:AAA family ATPase [Maribacter litopenaei]|uniref:AAA family ATPase n=1 Tax=Maribacter litopenaei TaxID=2976127 RepID=A0ABY5YCU7_9FLAO|nr:ATP-binding protein [Maribacter litopenaei]UWX56250.1 AAA family ATPase [Maribacter litopenaei]
MRILEVEINNYRSCIETRFDLVQNLMALIGANGVGKSNILYALQLFTKMDRNRRFFSHDSKEELASTQINLVTEFENKIIFFRAVFYYETDERNIDEIYHTEAKYRIQGENPRKWNNIDNVVYELMNVNFKRHFRRNELPKEFQSEKIQFPIRLMSSLSNLSYYSATQFSDPSKCPISIELDDFKISYRGRMNRIHQQFIFDLYKAYKSSNSNFELFINTVGINGLSLIENIEFREHTIPSSSYKVKTGGKIQQIENTKSIIIPSVKVDGLTLSPNQLSEGTFKTLALVFYILNDKNELLLIEEPEVCIHHGLLSSILQLIIQQSRYKQIIISTHSDYVLDMLSPENILLVHKEFDVGTKVSSISKSMSANEYRVLKDYLESEGNLGEYWKEGGFDYE